VVDSCKKKEEKEMKKTKKKTKKMGLLVSVGLV
jgi:hypothetical protein